MKSQLRCTALLLSLMPSQQWLREFADHILKRERTSEFAMQIRRAVESDFEAMWPIFRAVISKGDTYTFLPDTQCEAAFAYWFGTEMGSYVAEDDGRIVGMFKIVANQPGRGSHVANASFMVSPEAQGRGIGRAMAIHCLIEARRAGFRAMQFNIVVSTNESAVALWKSLGFQIVGTLPKAFRHATLGFVDAHVMYRSLDDTDSWTAPAESSMHA